MIIEQPHAAVAQATKDRSGYRWAFILVTSLFFMWGLSYGLVDVLNKHFQEILHVTKAQSGLLQAAYFGAYFVIALPAGMLISKYGYKAGILVGLILYALGALLFIPAASAASFAMFLGALFVIASGLGCLETAANPYATMLGDPNGAERRLNLVQSFNGLGQFVGPIIGGAVFFAASENAGSSATEKLGSVSMIYMAIAVVVLLLALLFAKTRLPDLRAQEEAVDRIDSRGLWQHGHFVRGVIAQFFFVAAQVGVGSFFINYVAEHWVGATSQFGSYLLSIGMICFMLGRFINTWLMGYVSPARLLMVYGVINLLLCAVVVAGFDDVAVIGLIAVFFFMSIMFPTIFVLGVKNLGHNTKRASSFMIMAIVGGAIMPYLMGLIADLYSTAYAYSLPMLCFAVVIWFGASQLPKPARS